MNPEVKAMWLEDLRSGEYEQARKKLAERDPETGQIKGYCCLGVLCERAVKEGVIPAPIPVWDDLSYMRHVEEEDPERAAYRHEYERNKLNYGTNEPEDESGNSNSHLPETVMQWAGLDEHNPDISVPRSEDDIEYDKSIGIEPRTHYRDNLAELNDRGASFTTIANYIEEQL